MYRCVPHTVIRKNSSGGSSRNEESQTLPLLLPIEWLLLWLLLGAECCDKPSNPPDTEDPEELDDTE